jgi:hypothetical protein
MQLVFSFVSTFLPLLNHSCFVSTLGIIAIANAIPDMGALSSLNLASNSMLAAGAKHIAQAISLVYCSNGTRFEETTLLWGSKCKHCGNPKTDHGNEARALIKLDISDNQIGAEQERGLQRICVAGGIELAK